MRSSEPIVLGGASSLIAAAVGAAARRRSRPGGGGAAVPSGRPRPAGSTPRARRAVPAGDQRLRVRRSPRSTRSGTCRVARRPPPRPSRSSGDRERRGSCAAYEVAVHVAVRMPESQKPAKLSSAKKFGSAGLGSGASRTSRRRRSCRARRSTSRTAGRRRRRRPTRIVGASARARPPGPRAAAIAAPTRDGVAADAHVVDRRYIRPHSTCDRLELGERTIPARVGRRA